MAILNDSIYMCSGIFEWQRSLREKFRSGLWLLIVIATFGSHIQLNAITKGSNISRYYTLHYKGSSWTWNIPDSKVHGTNMGPIWGRQGSGGPHVGPMNFAIWEPLNSQMIGNRLDAYCEDTIDWVTWPRSVKPSSPNMFSYIQYFHEAIMIVLFAMEFENNTSVYGCLTVIWYMLNGNARKFAAELTKEYHPSCIFSN